MNYASGTRDRRRRLDAKIALSERQKLLLVRRVSADDDRPILPTSGDEVAVDSVGAGVGELVLLCSGSSARHVFSGPNEAIDLAVVGIVDSLSR
ncbi:EutN/CcmL family microcompartment protein [Klebsiella pneumoniae]|uniref:Ethanolamine utilization protein EutN n=4 Tax=Klebsiella pneumoniae TaxID=573 RepID=A0A919I1H8_KLEPN|nr:ethanolamine utilization protein EutN [Klebsiella pneumoniae]GHK56897.1 ethanolamine utilization protein EutN [Klebsiella pneumoniae]CDL54304.1 Propanediol utilization polyhedral body protein PduN [Klebsiella pneumoniae]